MMIVLILPIKLNIVRSHRLKFKIGTVTLVSFEINIANLFSVCCPARIQ